MVVYLMRVTFLGVYPCSLRVELVVADELCSETETATFLPFFWFFAEPTDERSAATCLGQQVPLSSLVSCGSSRGPGSV